jgi:hypothetical protein
LPLPIALFVLSFAMRTESYWIIGPAASLAIAVGITLARTGALARGLTFGVLAIATAYATFAALFLALPEASQAAIFRAAPGLRSALASGAFEYQPLAADLRRLTAADEATIFTDGYETSAELLWYGLPSHIVVPSLQAPEWTRWYRSPTVPQHALLVMLSRPLSDDPELDANVRAAYRTVTPLDAVPMSYAGQFEGTFYITRLDDPLPGARDRLPGM